MGWGCGAYGWGEGVYRVLVGKPEGKRPLRRPRRKWVHNIRMDLQEMGFGYMDWIELAQDTDRWRKLLSAVMNLRVPWNAWNFLTSCKPVSCSAQEGLCTMEWVSKWVTKMHTSHLTLHTSVHCTDKPINVVWRNNLCLFWKSCATQINCVARGPFDVKIYYIYIYIYI